MFRSISRRSALFGLAAAPVAVLATRPALAVTPSQPADVTGYGKLLKEIKNGGNSDWVDAPNWSAKVYERGISVTHRGMTISRASVPAIGDAWTLGAKFPVADVRTLGNGDVSQMFTGAELTGTPGNISLMARYMSSDLTPATYKDVKDTHPHYEAIEVVTRLGFLTPYSDGSFSPARVISRGDFLDYCYKVKGSPAYTPPAKSPFVDVPTTHPHYKVICWAKDQGISNGWPNGKFSPNTAIKRDALSAMMYRMTPTSAYEFTPPADAGFVDVPKTHEFHREIEWMRATTISEGWEHGYSLTEKEYRPLLDAKRADIAAFIYRWHILFGDPNLTL